MAVQKSFGQRVVANLKKRRVQVLLCFAVFGGVVYGSQRVLGPQDVAKPGAKDPNVFKYLSCSECRFEIPYNPDQEKKACPRCKPPKVGYLTATKESIKKGGDGNPWRRYNIAVCVELVLLLAGLSYLLSRPVADVPTDYVLNCLHCGLVLRYKPDGFDQYALCPGCEQVIKLPDEDEAMTDKDREHVKETSILTAMEQDLRGSGHIVDPIDEDPHAEPPADGG